MPVSPAAFQQTVWNPVLDPTTLTRGAAASAPTVIPLNTELNPDTSIGQGTNDWSFLRCQNDAPGMSFTGGTNSKLTLVVPNTQGAPLSAGTYRVTIAVANFIRQLSGVTFNVGCNASGVGGASAVVPAGTIAGNGTFTKDIVVGSAQAAGGLSMASSSSTQMSVTSLGYERIV